MLLRPTLLLVSFLPAISGQSISVISGSATEVSDANLAAENKTDPNNTYLTGRLLRYLARDNRDPDWSARFQLLSWNVQHHPDAGFFASKDIYTGLSNALREQLKPLWVSQVQQHADDSAILRNAALALERQPSTIRIGSGVAKTNLIHEVQPEYPPLAKQAGVQGKVEMQITISPAGEVSEIHLLSGHPLLAQSAMDVVRQWLYRPTLLNGSPVAVITSVTVPFTLVP